MAKGIMIIDGQRVPFDGEKNVLAVIRKAGIDIPRSATTPSWNIYGACRMCMVEDVKTGKLDASCSMEPRDGMEIRTNTAKLLKHRRMILELLLALPRLLLHHLRQERQLPFAGAGTAVRRAAYPLPATHGHGGRRTTPATLFSAIPTSAFCAATASACARNCRDRAY